jgi:hypothetical protein
VKRLLYPVWLAVLIALAYAAVSITVALLKFEDVPGPTGPGVGAALLFAVIGLCVCIALICLWWRFRPSSEVRGVNAVVTVLITAAILAMFWFATHTGGGRYTLELQLLNPDGSPIASAPVYCSSLTDGQGRQLFLGRDWTSAKLTDTNGVISIQAHRSQSYSFTPSFPGYHHATIKFSAIYGGPLVDHKAEAFEADLERPGGAGNVETNENRDYQAFAVSPSSEIRVSAKLRRSIAAFAEGALKNPALTPQKVRSPLTHDGIEFLIALPLKDGLTPILLRLKSWTEQRTEKKSHPDWRVEVATENSEIQSARDDAVLEAPETGYTNSLAWGHVSTDPKWTADFDKFLYFKTPEGLHGLMRIEFLTWGDSVRIHYCLNPPGGRSFTGSGSK